MSGCCDNECAIDALRAKQRGTLQIVLGINAVMFLVIVGAALYSRSTALLADSFDNLGDALTYGLSLYVVSRSNSAKAKVALFKGLLIFLAVIVVLSQIIYRLYIPSTPILERASLTFSNWNGFIIASTFFIYFFPSFSGTTKLLQAI